MRNLVLIYAVLLVYGSLYPFGWHAPAVPMLAFLYSPLPSHWDRGDVLQNVLVYMPFGLLLVAWWSKRHRYWSALLLAMAAGTLLSLCVEFAQQWLPARVPSLLDILMNCAGSVAGGLLAALVRRDTLSGAHLLGYRDRWIRPGPLANTGLAALGLWVLAQTSPMVPSLDIAHLRHGLGQLWRQVADPGGLELAKLASLGAFLGGLGMLSRLLVQPGMPFLRLYGCLLAFVLGCKLLVQGRVLSLEMLLAAGLAWPAVALLGRMRTAALAGSGMTLLALGVAIEELTPVPGHAGRILAATLHFAGRHGAASHAGMPPAWGAYAASPEAFNWIPFLGQMRSLTGLANILEFLWPFMAMACMARLALPRYRHDTAAFFGAAAVALAMFMLEWMQLSVAGRTADITQVLLSCAGWIVPWCVAERARRPLAGTV